MPSKISIHALLAESDLGIPPPCLAIHNFYPRSPCGERPYDGLIASANFCHFYPRSPCGERLHYDNYNLHCVEISIHALLAESDRLPTALRTPHHKFLSTLSLRRATTNLGVGLYLVTISIHALLAESDLYQGRQNPERAEFLSTLSLRRATHYDNYNLHCVEISIHALLAESDSAPRITPTASRNFYPRSPCGERPYTRTQSASLSLFLSTLSLRRATE